MPIVKQWDIDAHTQAAIWRVEEADEFFLDSVGLSPSIAHARRHTEHMAGRYLLKHLQNDFPLHLIYKDEHDKPRLPENQRFFSISHSWPYVAVILSNSHEVGIDIEVPHRQIAKIKHKFLSAREQALLFHDEYFFLMAWCAKEAAYKCNGKREVAFIEHLAITSFNLPDCRMSIYLNEAQVIIDSAVAPEYICCYTCIKPE